MNTEQLLAAEPTLSANASALAYRALLTEQTDWRAYAPARSSPEVVARLVRRYLRSHATVPSLFSGEALSEYPMEIFACDWGRYHLHGALFANGAVVEVRTSGHPPYFVLFVDETVARTWGFPEEGYRCYAKEATS